MENKKRGFQFPDKFQDIDPVTGKVFLVPLNFGSKTRSGSPKKKMFGPLKPLDFEEIKKDLKDSEERPRKLRKIDEAPHSARRLFPSKPQNSRMTLNRNNTFRKISVPQRKISVSKSSSPLLNMEEVEQQLLKRKSISKGYQFKPPILPKAEFHFKHTAEKPKIPQIIVEEENDNAAINSYNVPKTPDSSQEFQKLEEICKDSPLTNMCNLMQSTLIHSGRKGKSKYDSKTDAIALAEEMFREEENRHKRNMSRLRQLITQEELLHKQNISKWNSLFLALGKSTETDDMENKENQTNKNRRSERLQKKSPIKNKLITSPAFLRSDDLRRSTLKKNLVAKNQDCQTTSPHAQKAFELYNSLKRQNSVLETPRSDRKNSNNLSSRIQNQCLLLQDTPVHINKIRD